MKWLVIVALAGCMSPVMHFGSGKSAQESQHDYLSELLPAQLSLDREYQGPVKDAKIRVYADDEYRAQNIKWRETFGEQLEYVNAVLGPKFGVHLVAEYREWDHHAPGNSLADDLQELSRLDVGDDVLSVVGLTSSLSLVSATFDLLGYASEPGRHIMLRGSRTSRSARPSHVRFRRFPPTSATTHSRHAATRPPRCCSTSSRTTSERPTKTVTR